jgi:tetratricopeptide (TPR) repeat protein
MSQMKKHWLRTLRNSAFGFLCMSCLAAPWAAAQAPATPGEPLSEATLGVLGVEKAQVDASTKLSNELQDAIRAFSARDAATALSKLETAHTTDPSLPPPNVMMARLCFATNDQNVVNLGRRYLEQAVMIKNNFPEPYLLLGRLALNEGRVTDAELNFEKALLYTPSDSEDKPNTLTEAKGWSKERHDQFLKEIYNSQVSVAEQRQHWDAAKAQLNAWILLDPKDATAKFRLGKVLFMVEASKKKDEKKDYQAARDALTEAYKLALEEKEKEKDPKKKDEVTVVPPPELAMLQFFSSNGATDDATDEVKKLTEKAGSFADKEKARVYAAMSQWYLQQNNPAEAGKLAAQAQSFDRESPALKQLAAVMHYYANDSNAVLEFEDMNRAAPEDFVASNYLALLLSESTDTTQVAKAVRLAELNVRLNPKSADAMSTLGWVYHKQGRTGEAMQAYNAVMQAVQAGQGQINADTAYYMARVIIDSPGEPTQKVGAVIQLLQQALKSTGPFKHRAEAQAWQNGLIGTGGTKAPTPGTTTLPPAGGTPPATPPTTPPATPPAGGNNPTPKAPSDN